jgi:hypothetical protein
VGAPGRAAPEPPEGRKLMRAAKALVLVLSAAVATAAAGSFKLSIVVIQGNAVPGVGAVSSIDNVAVNGLGEWIVEADTNNPDPNVDSVLIKNSALFLQQGQALPLPSGATISSFDSVNLNDMGNSGWNFFLDGTAGTNDDSGVYVNYILIIQESDLATAAALSPGTPYIGFFEVKINLTNGLLIMASVDDPAIATTVDRAIVGVTPDTLSEIVFAKEGDVLPGQTETVADFGTGPHTFDFNDNFAAMYIADLQGNTTTNGPDSTQWLATLRHGGELRVSAQANRFTCESSVTLPRDRGRSGLHIRDEPNTPSTTLDCDPWQERERARPWASLDICYECAMINLRLSREVSSWIPVYRSCFRTTAFPSGSYSDRARALLRHESFNKRLQISRSWARCDRATLFQEASK